MLACVSCVHTAQQPRGTLSRGTSSVMHPVTLGGSVTVPRAPMCVCVCVLQPAMPYTTHLHHRVGELYRAHLHKAKLAVRVNEHTHHWGGLWRHEGHAAHQRGKELLHILLCRLAEVAHVQPAPTAQALLPRLPSLGIGGGRHVPARGAATHKAARRRLAGVAFTVTLAVPLALAPGLTRQGGRERWAQAEQTMGEST